MLTPGAADISDDMGGQWRIQKLWKGGGQFIDLIVIYRKCTQRTIMLLYQKRRPIEKKFWANIGRGHHCFWIRHCWWP